MGTSLKGTMDRSSLSVQRWPLSGTDDEPQAALPPASSARAAAETIFSAWTPLVNKPTNQQLFEERTSLLLHWFDLWNDRQRKLLLFTLLSRCSKSQLKYCRERLVEAVPAPRVDFTAVLPRFLSLYVMSFLTPRDLCAAAQVSWHWRVLAEQDCLWVGRSVRRGWFLPYTPGEREYGAWKNHYVSCVSTLDRLTPREAAGRYGTLNQPAAGLTEEEEERRKERRIRQSIRERLEEGKRVMLRTRRAWGSNTHPGGARSGRVQGAGPAPGVTLSSGPSVSWLLEMGGSSDFSLSLAKEPSFPPGLTLERTRPPSTVRDSLNKAGGVLSSFSYKPPPRLNTFFHPITYPKPGLLLLLISNRIPAYELILSGVKAEVMVVLYDQRGTLPALLSQAERAIGGHSVQRLGLLAPGGTEEIHLLHGCSVSERTVLAPDLREFWEKLCGWVVPTEEGGGVDVFSPIAASAAGVVLIQTLSTLTGLEVRAPMGLATGSFQNILGEWCGGVCVAPPLQYVCEGVLQGWCRQAQWMEEALGDLRHCLGPHVLHRVSLEARGRALGHFLWERVRLEDVCVSKDLAEALTEGLTVLPRQRETRPLEFLSGFLRNWAEEKEGGQRETEGEEEKRSGGRETEGGEDKRSGGRETVFLTENASHTHFNPVPELPQAVLDWRGAVAQELYHSEGLYLDRLGAVLKVFHEPLTAAMNSNRAILSAAHIHMVLSPVAHILEVNRLFQEELGARLKQWGADQCVGDVCVKLCSKLRVYTNYLNNYPTALRTIDQCREMNPAFRAFLKRVDRTLATHTLSLQELLLCPVWRVEEYVTLLQALCRHTHHGHRDCAHLASALDTLQRYRGFIRKLKGNSERDKQLWETQKMIQGCPNLCEGNRHLICTQDAALLRSPDDHISDSLRTYEQVSDVGLFLFSDALVVTERRVCHTAFTLARRATHTFLASVALCSLAAREITHNRYVRNGFVLEAPSRSWVCATEGEDERERFLVTLRSAIHSALTES